VTGIDGVEILRIATALEPQYKTLRCLLTEDKGETWMAIAAKLSAAVDAEAHTEQLRVSHTDDDSDTVCEPMNKRIRLMDSDSDTDEPDETTTEEIAHFKAEKKLPDGENAANEHRFPTLAQLAKTALCVPVTSVPCERLFSSAGYIVNKRRLSLDPSTVNMLVCLHTDHTQ